MENWKMIEPMVKIAVLSAAAPKVGLLKTST